MIGKPEWFQRRKYGGWGLQPKSWQGWTYIAIFIIPLIIINLIPNLSSKARTIVFLIWIGLLVIDVFDIMRKLKHDERERIHEAIAERNALWGMILVIIFGIGYDIARSTVTQSVKINPFLIIALVIGVIIKAISNIYLDRKN